MIVMTGLEEEDSRLLHNEPVKYPEIHFSNSGRPVATCSSIGIVSRLRLALLEKDVEKRLGSLTMTGRRTNHEQGDSVCGGRAPCEHVLDRAGAPKLLRWQRCCRLAAHGRRRGMPMKRSEHSAVQSTLWVKSRHCSAQADVRFVPIADIHGYLRHVRCAKSGKSGCSVIAAVRSRPAHQARLVFCARPTTQ